MSKAQSATSATSAIAKIALRFTFFLKHCVSCVLRTNAFKICCAFKIFFRLTVHLYTLNLILFHFDCNINRRRPSLENYLFFFCLKSQKMLYLHSVVKFQLRELDSSLR